MPSGNYGFSQVMAHLPMNTLLQFQLADVITAIVRSLNEV